ncbi:MAG: cytochrome c-type biogenesis protein [Rhodospirillaceae bacterium]
MAAPDRAAAVNPDEMLQDPKLEARAREVSKELRCLVCQNQSIDDSDADLAKDLRVLVRERIKAGDDDGAIIRYVVDRYGDFVLLRPPVKGATIALWAGPAVIFLIGLFAVVMFIRRNRRAAGAAATQPAASPPPGLSLEERERIERILAEGRG